MLSQIRIIMNSPFHEVHRAHFVYPGICRYFEEFEMNNCLGRRGIKKNKNTFASVYYNYHQRLTRGDNE